MTNQQLEKMFEENGFIVRQQGEGTWLHIITSEHQLKIIHDEKKKDLTFKIKLFDLDDRENISFKLFLQFNANLLNGAFAIENDEMIFIDRIPSFDLHWGEAKRTILSAEIVCNNLNKYLKRALKDE